MGGMGQDGKFSDCLASILYSDYSHNKIFTSEIGLVKSNSIVPVLLSSAIDRIVIAGIRIRKIIGEELKNGIKSASVPSSKLASVEATQCIIPDVIK